MSNTDNQATDVEQGDGFKQPSRLDLLKRKADQLGVAYASNISEATLAKRIDEHLLAADQDEEEDTEQVEDEDTEAAAPPTKKKVSKEEQTAAERKRSQRLVRVIVRPVDPRRNQLKGELIAVGNGKLGFTTKYVPFNVESGYHIPEIIYNDLRSRHFTEFYVKTDAHGNEKTMSRQRKAFVVELLDPLTKEEVEVIANRQKVTLSEED